MLYEVITYDSITRHLFTLPGKTRVYPGHDYNGRTHSTIAEEKLNNPRIRKGIRITSYNVCYTKLLRDYRSAVDVPVSSFPDSKALRSRSILRLS